MNIDTTKREMFEEVGLKIDHNFDPKLLDFGIFLVEIGDI